MKRFPNKETWVTLEGFPRSANTFALYLVRELFPDKLISSHLHQVASVRRSLQLKKPCVILLRSPIEAVASLAQKDGVSAHNTTALNCFLSEWIEFYQFVLSERHRLAIFEFSGVVNQPSCFLTAIADFMKIEMEPGRASCCAKLAIEKIKHKEAFKNASGSSLPHEWRSKEKNKYIDGVVKASLARPACELFERLKESSISLESEERSV